MCLGSLWTPATPKWPGWEAYIGHQVELAVLSRYCFFWEGRRIIRPHWVFHGSRYLLNHSLTSFVRLVSPTRSEGYVGSSDPEGNFPSSKTSSLQNHPSLCPTFISIASDNPIPQTVFQNAKTGSLKNTITHSPSLHLLRRIIRLLWLDSPTLWCSDYPSQLPFSISMVHLSNLSQQSFGHFKYIGLDISALDWTPRLDGALDVSTVHWTSRIWLGRHPRDLRNPTYMISQTR